MINKLENSKVNFTITPNTLLFHSHNNVPVPHFSIEVVLHSTYCDIKVPFTGEVMVIIIIVIRQNSDCVTKYVYSDYSCKL